MLHKLIKLIHVDVHQKLRGKIAERKSYSLFTARKTADNILQKRENILVGNIFSEY